jgi:hypothetical protein
VLFTRFTRTALGGMSRHTGVEIPRQLQPMNCRLFRAISFDIRKIVVPAGESFAIRIVMLRYRIVDRDPAAGSSRIDDRDTTPISD